MQFKVRLSITSYGGLVQGLSKDKFYAGRSIPRNRELMRIFKDVKMVEQLGSGIRRILDVYDESIFKISDNFLEICFPFEQDYLDILKGGVITELTDRQKEFLNVIIKDNHISYKAIANKLGINESALSKHIKALKDKKVIKRIGGTRGYWEVKA